MTHGKPLSDDLRIALICMGRQLPLNMVSKYSGVPVRTIKRLFSDYRRDGHALRRKHHVEMRGAKQKLTIDDMGFVVGQIQQRRDIYLLELQDLVSRRLGIEVSESAIWKALRKRGFTMKKVTKMALERDEERRTSFQYQYGLHCSPESTVFVDESSFDRRTTLRNRAWALRGRKAERKWFFVRGRRYSLLPALTTNGMLYARVVEGSFTMLRFRSFLNGLLDRMDEDMPLGSYIIMDNARIHHDPSIVELIEQ